MRLRAALDGVGRQLDEAFHRRDWAAALESIASLRVPLEEFFTEVLVNAPEPALREARLALVSEVRDRIGKFADISAITVE
jgi:glycyl-tRNA synthetase beta chain